MSNPEQEFQPGQLVEYTGNYSEFQGVWEVIRYVGPSRDFYNKHIWELKWVGSTPPTNNLYIITLYNTSLKVTDKRIEAKGCTCSISDLMAKGCTCGQMAREKVS